MNGPRAVTRIDWPCREESCCERADFALEFDTDHRGTRSEYWCREHLPEPTRSEWIGEEAADGLVDAGLVRPYGLSTKSG